MIKKNTVAAKQSSNYQFQLQMRVWPMIIGILNSTSKVLNFNFTVSFSGSIAVPQISSQKSVMECEKYYLWWDYMFPLWLLFVPHGWTSPLHNNYLLHFVSYFFWVWLIIKDVTSLSQKAILSLDHMIQLQYLCSLYKQMLQFMS